MKNTVLSTYHYDPLNRLTGINSALKPANQRFYCNKRLVTEIQGTVQHSYIQGAHQLLAQQTHDGDQHNSVLFATDRQRSVLKILNTHDIQSAAYTPYGHRRVEHNSSTLLGFNGERIEPATEHYLLGNGYRAFNAVLMRFNSPDTMSPFGKGGINSYAYCRNNPMNLRDDNGHFPLGTYINYAVNRARRLKINQHLDTYSPLTITSLDQPLTRGHTLNTVSTTSSNRKITTTRFDSNGNNIYSKTITDFGQETGVLVRETGKPSKALIGNNTFDKVANGQNLEPSTLQHQAYSNLSGPQLNDRDNSRHLMHIKNKKALNTMNYLERVDNFDRELASNGISGSERISRTHIFDAQVRAGKIRGVQMNSDIESYI